MNPSVPPSPAVVAESETGRPAWVEALYPLLNVLQVAFLLFWSAFCITLAFMAGLVTFRRELPLAMARWMWAPPLIGMTGARLTVEPLPDVDWSKPHIFLMNHQSSADIPVAFAVIPSNLRFVAKHTLKYVPFIGWYMWFTGMIFIDRSNRGAAVKSLRLAGERIRAGSNILAYPEGTRSTDGHILPFKKGPFMLALEAKVPIIPVVIEGTGTVLPRGGFKFRRADVRVRLGQPIETAHLTHHDRDDLMRRTQEIMSGMHQELGGLGSQGEAIAAAGVEGSARVAGK